VYLLHLFKVLALEAMKAYNASESGTVPSADGVRRRRMITLSKYLRFLLLA
jgi:hypothetical protein